MHILCHRNLPNTHNLCPIRKGWQKKNIQRIGQSIVNIYPLMGGYVLTIYNTWPRQQRIHHGYTVGQSVGQSR